MSKPVFLSGYDLVAKGITKNQASLPELGLKDVFPNGSWLEAKQIQSAIDARKQLIAVERIEKSGMLSHAEWRENLMLAEVIQKSGGHWQFMGHNVGKQLYLYPEEALFLIELNSLLLKHNGVKVSLQQAYTLLLRDKYSLIQYKVYATLSKWGYKVFRHTDRNVSNVHNSDVTIDRNIKSEQSDLQKSLLRHIDDKEKVMNTVEQNDSIPCNSGFEAKCNLKRKSSLVDDSDDSQTNGIDDTIKCKKPKNKHQTSIYVNKIEKNKNRQLKPCNAKIMHKLLEKLPNFLNNEVVTLTVPNKNLIPSNITLSNTTYTINLNSIKTKQLRDPSPQGSQTSSSTGEVNRGQFRRIRGNSRFQFPPYINYSPINYPRYSNPFGQNNCWHSYLRANYYHFNMSYQRPFLGNLLFTPRFQYYPRFQNLNRPRYNYGRPYYNRRQRRPRDNTKKNHFEYLKKLAARLKNLITSGVTHTEPLAALINLINTYNSSYGTKVKLSEDHEIIEVENILDTIELDDEGEHIKKKTSLDSNSDTYTNNFNNIKLLAERLKSLEDNNKSSARHRRAFSNLIKTFNKSYNADIYVTSNFDVLDRSFIILETSSDSDCKIDENSNSSGKKVRNPFNILKRLSEKRNQSLDAPGTSSDSFTYDNSDDFRSVIKKNLSKEWIPDDNDFGRPEFCYAFNEANTANLFYEFMKLHPENYENWLDFKVSFFQSLEETADFFRKTIEVENVQNRSLVSPEDCVDIVSVLKKLSIIKSYNKYCETSLVIEFDVYNRDVQNFRKTNPPAPHFRISCIDESTKFPSSEEIASLHAKYNDDVRIVFAIVGNSTMNFVRINPISLPTHIANVT